MYIFSCQSSIWDSSSGPNAPLLPISSEHNDQMATAINSTTISSNPMITNIHHTFANSYMQIQPEIQTLAETSSSSNTIDSKKHHRRKVMKTNNVSFFHPH